MKYSLTIEIHEETITIFSADGSVRNTYSNLISLDENDKFVSIGKTPEEIREEAPQEWEKVKDRIHFHNVFSLNYFRPELAASSIEYLVYLTTHPTPKSQMTWIKDTVELFLQIPGYERLPISTQESFEFHLQETGLIKSKSLLINNQVKSFSNIHWAKQIVNVGLPTFVILVLLLAFYLSLVLMGERYSVIPEDEKWSFFLVSMILVTFIFYFASFIFMVFWKFATRNLISDSISRKIIERNKVGLPKSLVDFIWRKLPPEIGGE